LKDAYVARTQKVYECVRDFTTILKVEPETDFERELLS